MLATVVLPIVLAFIMFSLGIGLTLKDFGRVLTRPRAVLIGATAQMLVLPIIAFVLLLFFDLPPAFKVGVMILSFVPGGTTLNMITNLARGDVALSVTLRTLTCRPIGPQALFPLPQPRRRPRCHFVSGLGRRPRHALGLLSTGLRPTTATRG